MSDTAAKLPSAPPAVARTNPTPPGWAKDELTKFLQETHQQQYGESDGRRLTRGCHELPAAFILEAKRSEFE